MYIKAEVYPESKEEKVIKKGNKNKYEIYIREPARNNLANKRVIILLKEILNVERIQIVSGYHSRHKILKIIK